jgi:hypothetical protein
MYEFDYVLTFEAPLRIVEHTRYGVLIGCCIYGVFTQHLLCMFCGGAIGGLCGCLWGCKQDMDEWLGKRVLKI